MYKKRVCKKQYKDKSAQISMEYMIVIGFTLLMITPLLVIYGKERQNINDQVNSRQAFNIARKIVDSAHTVYYLGKPAKTTLKVYMPNNVEDILFRNYTIIFRMKSGLGTQEIMSESSVNLTGKISTGTGIQYIDITAQDYAVNITTRK